MTTDWTFLERWYAAVRTSFVQNVPTDSTNEMQVSFQWPFQSIQHRKFSLIIDLETKVQQNVLKLIHIREAMELFTVLSVVDNKAFTEQFPHITQSMNRDDRRWYPRWALYVRGSAVVQQATWCSPFAFPNTSLQFKRALEKLTLMGFEDLGERLISDCIYIHMKWLSKVDGADVDMDATLKVDNNDTFNGMKTGLQSLVTAGVHLITTQLGLTGDAATLVDLWRNQSDADERKVLIDISLSLTIHDFTTTYSRVLTGLALLPIRSVKMGFNKENIEMRAEVHLNRVCGVVCYNFIARCDRMSSSMLPAIYSIQATRSDTTSVRIIVDSVDSESWPLLVDAICCGPCREISVILKNVILTNSDLLKFTDAVPYHSQSRIGNGVSEISHNSEGRNLQVSSAFRDLDLTYTTIESASLVINLLGLIGSNLRSLTLNIARRVDMTLDLSELSAVCVNLKYLVTCRIHVVVSAHTETLSLWPIQYLSLDCCSKLSDLTLCLRNPNLRMAHELMSIEISGEECNEEQKDDLLIHDGDFLSIRKEKVPIRSKAAMISVVYCTRQMKTIHRLHEDVLGLIFSFASTPATR